MQKRKKKDLPISCAAEKSGKTTPEPLLSQTCTFDDGCWMSAARQFEKNPKSVILMKY
jgi:hypothetical protein